LADARRHELLGLRQAEEDAKLIQSGKAIFQDGKLVHLPLTTDPKLIENRGSDVPLVRWTNTSDVSKLANQIEQSKKIQEAANLGKAIIFAEEAAEEMADEPVSDEPVDPDWFTQWQRYTQEVSNEDMLRLWGKILAQETRDPRSY